MSVFRVKGLFFQLKCAEITTIYKVRYGFYVLSTWYHTIWATNLHNTASWHAIQVVMYVSLFWWRHGAHGLNSNDHCKTVQHHINYQHWQILMVYIPAVTNTLLHDPRAQKSEHGLWVLHIFIYSTKMMSIFTKKNIKTCNSTTKVQNMYKKYSTTKTERHINQMQRRKNKYIEQKQRYNTRTIKITTFTI